MTVRVITARYLGKCGECGAEIKIGQRINYGGRGAVSCEGCRPLARVKTRYGSRVYGGQSATGARCIDAPCCGCCD